MKRKMFTMFQITDHIYVTTIELFESLVLNLR